MAVVVELVVVVAAAAAAAVGDLQLDNLKSTTPNCLAHLHGCHCCPSGWSTMAQSPQVAVAQRCTHCRLHHQIGMGIHMAC